MRKLSLMMLLLILGSGSVFSKDNPYITWMGCDISKKAFMARISKAYTKKTGIIFRMAGGGATKGIRLTATGHSDIGGSCRHRLFDDGNTIIPEERSVNMIRVGWDALVVITSKQNSVDNLSLDQLIHIFKGDIVNWQEVGGANEKITLLVRKGKTSGVGHMFRLMLMNDKDFEFPADVKQFRSSGPLEETLERLKSYRYSIGVTGVSSAKKRQVKILSLNGITPTKEHLMRGEYPLFRPLYMVIGTQPDEKTKRFVDFILSNEGQSIISNEGTVNLEEGKLLEERWLFQPPS